MRNVRVGVACLLFSLIMYSGRVFAQWTSKEFQWESGIEQDLQTPEDPDKGIADALILFDRYRFDWRGRAPVEEDYRRIKIFNERGYQYASQKIQFDERHIDVKDIRARTILPDGGIIELDPERDVLVKEVARSRNRRVQELSIAFPQVTPGCIIESYFRVDGAAKSIVPISSRIAKNAFEITWYLPSSEAVNALFSPMMHVLNSRGIRARMKSWKDFYHMSANHIARMEQEEFAPPLLDREPAAVLNMDKDRILFELQHLHIETKHRGEGLVHYEGVMLPHNERLIPRLQTSLDRASAENAEEDSFKFFITQLTGLERTLPLHAPENLNKYWIVKRAMEKARHLNFIQQKDSRKARLARLERLGISGAQGMEAVKLLFMEFQEYAAIQKRPHGNETIEELKDVLLYRRGSPWQLSVAFAQMINDLGFESIVLYGADKRHQGFASGVFSIAQFDHYIVRVTIPGEKMVFLLPGDADMPFGFVPWYLQGIPTLPVCASSKVPVFLLIPTELPDNNRVLVDADVLILPDRSAEARLKWTMSGQHRLQFDVDTVDSLHAALKQDWLASCTKQFPNTCIDISEILGFDSTAGKITIQAVFKIPDYVQEAGDRLIVQSYLPILARKNPFVTDKRTDAIHFPYCAEEITNARLTIPEGYRFEADPGMINLKTPFATFVGGSQVSGPLLIVQDRFSMTQNRIDASEYATVREFYQKRADWRDTVMLLQKKE